MHDIRMRGGVLRIVCYVEFFTNVTQENLFIGMFHAFALDSSRQHEVDHDGARQPEHAYLERDIRKVQELVGFRIDLCKVPHSYTEGL